MTLREVIEMLEKFPPETRVANGFGDGDSWRGVYAEIAFEPKKNTTVGEMLACARACDGATMQGYKGGDFLMGMDTDCNVASYGEYGGDSDRLFPERLAAMIAGDPVELRSEIDALRARLAEVERERDEARRLVVGTAMFGSKCAYCGALVKVEDMNNFDGIALQLRRHAAKCPKHPSRKVERALAASQAECAKLRGALEYFKGADEADVALSAPSDDSALREVCEKVALYTLLNVHHDGAEIEHQTQACIAPLRERAGAIVAHVIGEGNK